MGGLDRLWDNLTPKLREEYGQEYKDWFRKLLGLALNDFGNTNSNLVPEAMVDALTCERPQYRYRVGLDSKYLITFLSWLPEWLQDMALTHTDSRCPEVTPATAPSNGRQLMAKRYYPGNLKYYIIFIVAFLIYRR